MAKSSFILGVQTSNPGHSNDWTARFRLAPNVSQTIMGQVKLGRGLRWETQVVASFVLLGYYCPDPIHKECLSDSLAHQMSKPNKLINSHREMNAL